MELSPTLPQRGATLSLVGNRPEGLALREGQQVQAVVRAVGKDGGLLLEMNGRQLEAKTDLALLPGQRLKLSVEQKADQLLLRLLERPTGSDTLSRGLRSALPRQEPLARLTAGLERLTRETSALPKEAAEPVQRLRNDLLSPERAARADSLKRAVLDSGLFAENKLAQGRTESLHSDLKVALLRVAAALRAAARENPAQVRTGAKADPASSGDKAAGSRGTESAGTPAPGRPATGTPAGRPAARPGTPAPPTPASPASTGSAPPAGGGPAASQGSAPPPQGGTSPSPQGGNAEAQNAAAARTGLSERGLEFLRQVESALARVQLNQITSLPSQESPEPQWVIELPLYAGEEDEGLRLRVRRDGGGEDDEGGPRWSVTLEYNSSQHGPVHMVVTLASGQVSVTFWSERPETAGLFHDNLEALQARLSAAGLDVADLSSRRGLPRQDDPAPDTDGLLDLTV